MMPEPNTTLDDHLLKKLREAAIGYAEACRNLHYNSSSHMIHRKLAEAKLYEAALLIARAEQDDKPSPKIP